MAGDTCCPLTNNASKCGHGIRQSSSDNPSAVGDSIEYGLCSLFSALCRVPRSKFSSASRIFAGHEVRVTNLYEDKFQAALGGKEHRGFMTAFREGKVEDDVKSHVEDLQWCSGLVLCYPTWWYSFPAILKVTSSSGTGVYVEAALSTTAYVVVDTRFFCAVNTAVGKLCDVERRVVVELVCLSPCSLCAV